MAMARPAAASSGAQEVERPPHAGGEHDAVTAEGEASDDEKDRERHEPGDYS